MTEILYLIIGVLVLLALLFVALFLHYRKLYRSVWPQYPAIHMVGDEEWTEQAQQEYEEMLRQIPTGERYNLQSGTFRPGDEV